MKSGKKSIAEKTVYDALLQFAELMKVKVDAKEIVQLLTKALDSVAPTVEVKSRRVGGTTYPVPNDVSKVRGYELARRWIVKAARKRTEKTMAQRLAAELNDAMKGRGGAIKDRDEMHRIAKANQAFAHYRW